MAETDLLAAAPAAKQSPAAPDENYGERVLRKAGLRLLPLLGLGYGVAYIDRANVSFAALQMNRQLHFSASIYGLGAGLFFLGYSLFEVPSNMLLLRFGARRWLARILMTWGVVAGAMLLVRTPREFYTMRFLLGMAEAGFFPGVIYYLTQWFPAEEQARAVSRFYVAFPLGAAVMGGIAGTLLRLDGRLNLAGWQWLFLMEGVPAVVLGCVFLRWLPDGPQDAPWLSVEERTWLRSRLASEHAATGGHISQREDRDGGWPVLVREPRFWQMSLFYLCMLTAVYAYTFSAPAILVQVTGWTPGEVGYLTGGFNLLAAAAMIVNAQHSDRTRERYLHVALPFLLMAVGFAACSRSLLPWIAVPALALSTIAYTSTMGPGWAIPPTFLTGKAAARGIAAINTIGMLGGFIGPWWMGWMKDRTGSYGSGVAGLSLLAVGGAAVMLWMRAAERSRAALG